MKTTMKQGEQRMQVMRDNKLREHRVPKRKVHKQLPSFFPTVGRKRIGTIATLSIDCPALHPGHFHCDSGSLRQAHIGSTDKLLRLQLWAAVQTWWRKVRSQLRWRIIQLGLAPLELDLLLLEHPLVCDRWVFPNGNDRAVVAARTV